MVATPKQNIPDAKAGKIVGKKDSKSINSRVK
jgi:hypothetical protein